MKTKPDLSFWKLWNLSFGFFGVQIAYALQSANVSRIFATLGADPHDLSYFWILPPLMGLVVQPLVGTASDKTWTRIGRRLPYLIVGAVVAVLVMCLLPNAGSFGLAVSSAILIGLVALMLLDTSINMAMQPFKMLVGDMVNEKQKGLAYSIQSFLCNAGSIVGYVFPFLLTWIGFKNTAAAGVIPQTVVFSFYFGAAILLGCVLYTLGKVKEWPPQLYREYNGGAEESADGTKEKTNLFKLLVKAPKTFWTVGLVQFFCWFAFLFMWTYTNGTIAKNAFDCPETTTIQGIAQTDAAGNTVNDISAKYILVNGKDIVVDHGKATVAGIETADGRFIPATSVAILRDDIESVEIKSGGIDISVPAKGIAIATPVVTDDMIHTVGGISPYALGTMIPTDGSPLLVNGSEIVSTPEFKLIDYLSRMSGPTTLTTADICARDPKTGELVIDGASEVVLENPENASFRTSVVLNTESAQYNDAGNWVGILFAVQAIGSVLWAVVLPMFRSRKFSYALSLLLGAAGFISAGLLHDQYLLFVSFFLIGCAWAAMLAWPFTILTNSLKGGNIGAYLGLFNCSICIPQIVGALLGGWILSFFGGADTLAPQHMMMIIAGISLCLGAIAVAFIKEHQSETTNA
ncbi:MAG: MFS transporter [[Clostridium] fimetarium]|nr:MFS transporter [Alistipes timonensis]MCM1405224.1 MFS transporter [[Clostridium] fimetarium]